jgi:energy-coupling factor transporter transmembrane protein EcfT
MKKLGMPHAAVQIYIWFCLTLAVENLSGNRLLVLVAIVLSCTLIIGSEKFFSLLRRTRWILVSILVIYSYSTQGEVLIPQFGEFSPVINGVEEGFVRLLRLLAVLAGLSILLSLLLEAQLLAGLYKLLQPFSRLGLPTERVVVRLALTLGYAESAMKNSSIDWKGRIHELSSTNQADAGYVEFEVASLSIFDRVLAGGATIALLGVWG